jgi:hypothetical protein
MNEAAKAIPTIIIWLVAGGIAITALIASRGDIGTAIPIIAIVMAVGLFSTAAIWTSEGAGKNASQRITETPEKAKRRGGTPDSRMALLMEMMNEDEREAFKETLKRRILDEAAYGGMNDGELPESLSDLMDEGHGKRLR